MNSGNTESKVQNKGSAHAVEEVEAVAEQRVGGGGHELNGDREVLECESRVAALVVEARSLVVDARVLGVQSDRL